MTYLKVKALPQYFNLKQSALSRLQQQVMVLNKLSLIVQQCLPEDIASICRVVHHHVDEDRLVISISEQLFLTQMRFLRPQLLQQLRRHSPFKQLKSIEFIFTPAIPGPNQPQTPPLSFSQEAKNACKNAVDLCHHESLKQALQHLVDSV